MVRDDLCVRRVHDRHGSVPAVPVPRDAIEAEPQALEFLIHMIRNRGQLVTKDMPCIETFWPDRVVSDAALSTLVRNRPGASSATRAMNSASSRRAMAAGSSFKRRRSRATRGTGGRPVRRCGTASGRPARPRVEGALRRLSSLPFEIVGETRRYARGPEGGRDRGGHGGSWPGLTLVSAGRPEPRADVPGTPSRRRAIPFRELGAALTSYRGWGLPRRR
jgi:hypothetical protein